MVVVRILGQSIRYNVGRKIKEIKNMKKYDSFFNKYSISKTLRFSLIPIGKTEENFNAKLLLKQDKKRANAYKIVKECIDDYHRFYIEERLSQTMFLNLPQIGDYAKLYYKGNKTQSELQTIEKSEAEMRKIIAKHLTSGENYKSIMGKEIIEEILPKFLTDNNKIAAVKMFDKFTTYFEKFNKIAKICIQINPNLLLLHTAA